MLQIEFGSIEEQLISYCQIWLDKLTEGEVFGIDMPNDYGLVWDIEKIDDVVKDYLGEGVTPEIFSKNLKECYPNFYKRNDGGYNLEFDLPLNGELSDLTVQFEFNRKGSKFVVVLHDIHVL